MIFGIVPCHDQQPLIAHWFSVATFVLLMITPASARAYEDQVTLGLDVGAGLAVSSDFGLAGAQIGLSVGWGWSDAWLLQGRASYALHPDGPDVHVPIVGLETVYLLDILQIVPLLGIGMDAIAIVSSGQSEWNVAVHAMVGLDYLLNREWIIGFDFRAYLLPQNLSSDLVPWYVSFGFRVTKVFERY